MMHTMLLGLAGQSLDRNIRKIIKLPDNLREFFLMPQTALAYGAQAAGERLTRMVINRRDLSPHDVALDILFCGVCHSDIHFARDDWFISQFPLVPGHEIIGVVSRVGSAVSRFSAGDRVGVGCIVDSCRRCVACIRGEEQYCKAGYTFVFNDPDVIQGEGLTSGGFSSYIVVNERYVIRLPQELRHDDLPRIAPLLCAGITVASPLAYWEIGEGARVGIVGIGGLGHLAVKIAAARGALVTAITSSESKLHDCARLGALRAVRITEALSGAHNKSFDYIIDTLPVPHSLAAYIDLLDDDGVLCVLGIPAQESHAVPTHELIQHRRSVVGSMIGGIAETEALIEWCAQKEIFADIETIAIEEINEAFKRIEDKSVRYRYVIDMTTLT